MWLLQPRFLMPTYPVDDFSFFLGSISQSLYCLVLHSPLKINGLMYYMISCMFSTQLIDKTESNSKECFLESDDLNFGPRVVDFDFDCDYCGNSNM